MNFSKTASYSLNILSFMATHDEEPLSAAVLHKKLEIPYPYLRAILTDLTYGGLIKSTRGRSGGFTFSKSKKDISLADIIDITDGLDSLNRCILGFRECPFNNECSMHTVWEETRSKLLNVLKSTSLDDISRKR